LIFRFRKFFFIFLGSLWLLSSLNLKSFADVPIGELPTGLVELKEFRYPVYLFVPPGYKKTKERSMVAVFPSESSLEEAANKWSELAKKRNMLVLISEAKVRDEDVPYQFDTWFLNVQKTLAQRYGVTRTFLLGEGLAAHYAAYLGLKYPDRLAGIATLGGSWVGPFAKLTKLSAKPRGQAPFFAALPQDDKKAAEAQATAERMTAKGYDVRLLMLEKKDEEKTGHFREMMIDWLVKSAAAHETKLRTSKKSLKEKTSTAFEEFFSMQE
jgi:pimeloyl-ACP methyl ester carboxylesterase